MIVFLLHGCLVANPQACWNEKWTFDVEYNPAICNEVVWDLVHDYMESNKGYVVRDWGCFPFDPMPTERADDGDDTSGSGSAAG